MISIPLPNGRSMPALGLGTWDLRGQACEAAVAEALKIGYRHVDTAEMYGNEAEIGRALKASGLSRRDLFVTTKVWTNHHRAGDFKRAAGDSLRRLGLSEVDLLLIHWPNPSVPLEETVGALCQVAREGQALSIGVSNFDAALLKKALSLATVPLSCDQVPYSLPENQDALLARARAAKVAVCAYTPLGRGSFLSRPELGKVAARHARTPAQVALRWLVQQDGVAAIPKAAGPGHLKENFEIFDFELDREDGKLLERCRG